MPPRPEIHLLLHNIRSAQNVGAIFRVADAAAAAKIWLTGYTPAPLDRFGRVNREIAKTALGAEKYVEWKKIANVDKLFKELSAFSFQLLALEQANNSIDYKKVKIKGPTAIIVGNEVRGLHPVLLKRCDVIVEIPMRGRKESLNVAVALGIFLFRLI